MMQLSDRKKTLLDGDMSSLPLWYITPQTCDYVILCFMCSILEKWNENSGEPFEKYFDRTKVGDPYNKFIPAKTAHRALKNCEYYGLTLKTTGKESYSPNNLTSLYYEIKNACGGHFNEKNKYQDKIDKSIFDMVTPVGNYEINAVPYTLKVILVIGDLFGDFKISLEEFKLFVCTSNSWFQYMETAASILRYRKDANYKEECRLKYNESRIQHIRLNTVFANLSYIDQSKSSDISIVVDKIDEVRRIVADFETTHIFDYDLANSFMLNNKTKVGDYVYDLYLSALRTKPFLLLAGISGTGKSRIVRKLAQATVTKELQEYDGTDFDKDRWSLHRPANFELVQVKPNWHNSMDVVGYLSNIPKPHYVFTPFVEFVVKAWMNPDVPFFLCLDEMNLAPVEEYFAEFLSAIESRAFEDGKYVTDPIIKPFNSFGEGMGDSMINTLNASLKTPIADELKTQLVEKGLSLPKNLIVVGTVNMDETTYSFSRKVLDRAMSIEMNDVDYDNFLADSTDDELKTVLSKINDINQLLVNRHIEAKEVVGSLGKDAETVIGYLKKVNTLLEGTPFKLGYRAANEALIYVAAAKDFGFYDVEAALDQFTLMKILSRLEGDSSKMKVEDNDKRLSLLGYSASDVKDKRAESPDKETITLLTCMHKIIEDFLLPKPKSLEETVTVTDLANPDEVDDKESDDKKKLKSLEKIENMIAQLHRERFVSYWN